MTATLERASGLARLRELVLRSTPEQLRRYARGLDPDEASLLEEVLADLGAEHWRADPVSMGHHLEPEQVELYPYSTLLGRKWTQLEDGSDPYQIWNLPAQYGKSTICQWGLAWSLDRRPSNRYITTSYGDELADRNGLATRDILDNHAETLRARIRRDQRRKDRFMTPQGGGLLAAGLFAGMTGWGAHGIVIDDPFKGWQEAHSGNHRQLVWNTYRSVVFLRRTTSRAWILIVMTRWHEDDIVGRLVDEAEKGTGKRFTVTRLAEVAEEPVPDSPNPVLRLADPLGRAPGELLEERRFDQEAVDDKRLVLGTYLFAGMALQRPAPEEGTEIMRAWFRVETQMPTSPDEAISSWDMKLKDKESGDYVAGGCWWRVGPGFWLMDQLRGQWNQATTENAIALLQVRHPETRTHVIENTGNGPEVITALRSAKKDYLVSDEVASALGMNEAERGAVQALRRRGMAGIIANTPKGPKPVRMRAVSGYIEAGDVHLPATMPDGTGNPWLGIYLEEMAAFPNGANDDQVDQTSQALARLAKGPSSATAAEGRVPTGPGQTATTDVVARARSSVSAPAARIPRPTRR